MSEAFENLPGFGQWKKEASTDLDYYFLLELRARSFIASLLYLNPETYTYEDLVLRKSPTYDPQSALEMLEQKEMDKSQTEYLINKQRVKDIFFYDPDTDQLDSAFLTFIARQLKEVWQQVIPPRYPGREFEFGIRDENVDPVVYFICERENKHLDTRE